MFNLKNTIYKPTNGDPNTYYNKLYFNIINKGKTVSDDGETVIIKYKGKYYYTNATFDWSDSRSIIKLTYNELNAILR